MLIFQAITEALETEEQIKTAEQIFENYRNAMFQVAYNILKNKYDAEETVGDTIIKVCRHINDFTAISGREQKLLVKKYTERAAIDKWRERKRSSTEVLSDYILDTTDSESDAFGYEDEIVFEGEEIGVLQKYVLKLSPKYKDILILKYVNELKNKEIAELMHIPESTVATQLERAKKQLRKLVEEGSKK